MTGVWLVGVAHIACKIERERCGLRQIKVEVGTVVESVVAIIEMIVLAELLEESALRVVADVDEIACVLSSTTDVQIMLGLKRGVFHNVVCPYCAWESDRVTPVFKFLYDGVRELTLHSVKIAHQVMEGCVFIAVGLLYHLGGREHTPRCAAADMSIALGTTLRGDEDDAVGTADTEDSRCRGILQHGDALYFLRVDVAHRALDTINLHEWVSVVERGLATDEYTGSVTARLTGVLHGGHAGELSAEHIID